MEKLEVIKPGATIRITKPGEGDWITGWVDSVEICMNGALKYHVKAWFGSELKSYTISSDHVMKQHDPIEKKEIGFKK